MSVSVCLWEVSGFFISLAFVLFLLIVVFFFLVPSHFKLLLSQALNFLAFVLPILSLSDSGGVIKWLCGPDMPSV